MEPVIKESEDTIFEIFDKTIKNLEKEVLKSDDNLEKILNKYILKIIIIYREMEADLKTKSTSLKKFKKEELTLVNSCRHFIEKYLTDPHLSNESVVELLIITNYS